MIHLLPTPLLSVPDVEGKRSILLDNLKTTFKAIGDDKAKRLEYFIDLNECKNGATTEIVRSLVQEIEFKEFSLSPSDLQAISSTMKQCKYLETVNLRGCNLNEEKVAILWKTLMQSDLKFNELFVGDNRELGPKGMKLVGKLIKTHEVKVLGAWDCNIKSEHVEGLADGLGGAIIDSIDLEDDFRKPLYTRSLLKLLQHVREKLNLEDWKINERQQEEIQNELNKIGSSTLTVIVGKRYPYTELKAVQVKSKSGMHKEPSTSGTIPTSSSTSEIVPVSRVSIAKDEAKNVTGMVKEPSTSEISAVTSENEPASGRVPIVNDETKIPTGATGEPSTSEIFSAISSTSEIEPAAFTVMKDQAKIATGTAESSTSEILAGCPSTPETISGSDAVSIVKGEANIATGETNDERTNTGNATVISEAASVSIGVDPDTNSVTTKFGNLTGGLAISKSVSKKVGAEKDSILVGCCTVVFHSESFPEPTSVPVTAEIDSTKWPKNFIGLTPTLYVQAKGLRRKAHIKLPLWCQSEKAEAKILHLPLGSNEWEDTGITLPLTGQPFIEFEWGDFSPVVAGFWPNLFSVVSGLFPLGKPMKYEVAGGIYVSDFNELSVVFHLKNDLVFEAVENKMKRLKHPKHLQEPIRAFSIEVGKIIKTELECTEPSNVEVKPSGLFSFIVEHDIAKEPVYFRAMVSGNFEGDDLIELSCNVEKSEEGSELIPFTYKPMKKKSTNQKQSSEQQIVRDVNINIHGQNTDNDQKQTAVRDISVKIEGSHTDNKKQNITAGHMYMEDSKTELHQSGTSTSVATSSASTSQ